MSIPVDELVSTPTPSGALGNSSEISGSTVSGPLISVIIPSYNCGDYIAETIHSVLGQGYQNFEILVMDGGSTDRTREVVDALNSPKLTFVQAPDLGQLDAVLKGIDRASGDILFWLNADDIVLPDAFQHVTDIFKANENIDIVYADSFAFDAVKREIYVSPLIRGLGDLDHLLFYRQFYSECVYWRRALRAEIPEDQRHFRVYTDYAFFLRLKWGRNLLWTAKRLGAFRIRGGQMSDSQQGRADQEFISIRDRFRKDLGFSTTRIRLLKIMHAPSFYLRLGLLPNLARLSRVLYRQSSGDRDRKDLAALFYAWIERSTGPAEPFEREGKSRA